LIGVLVVALGAMFFVPAAHAAFGIEQWSTITCKENSDTPEVKPQPEPPLPPVTGKPPIQDPEQCNTGTPTKWFTQAAGHPNFAFTDFTLNTLSGEPFAAEGKVLTPDGFVRDIIVDAPEGLSVNPEALPKCTLAQLGTNSCPKAALVGANYFTVQGQPVPCEPRPPGSCVQARVALPVYNLVPDPGAPSMVGFLSSTGITKDVGSLDPVDQHVIFTISPVHAPPPAVIGSRLVFNGKAGNGTYLTMPSNCGVKLTTTVEMDQYAAPGVFVQKPFETAVAVDGCAAVPFKPTINAVPQGDAVDSPEATEVNVGIPFDPTELIANSYLKTAKVVLPEGTSLNPASANGLVGCTDAQFARGTNDPIACPAASKVGTVEVQTPSLPADSLTGTVYVGQPLNQIASTGEQFRIFIHVGSERYGVNVRLEGKVFPDPSTGQLTAVVDENPQATFSSFKIRLNGGSKGTLTSPPICGPHTTKTVMTPWSGHADANEPESSFTLTSDPQGGSCPQTLGERKFAPTYSDHSDSTVANAYSPFHVHLNRVDGEQELKVVNVTLPKGLSGKIAGVPYCSNAALTAAAASTGKAESAASSCSSASQLGNVTTSAGSGGNPIRIAGKAFLAGPYKGAPISMATITPAVAGPYDLGTVVVRIPLYVNPETTQINAVSDVIPSILGGVKLDIRTIDVDLNRSQFMHNPTNCDAKSITGAIQGGGSNPADPAAFSSYPVLSPYSTTDCSALAFKPKLNVKLVGKKATKRRQHPGIQAVLTTKESEANVSYTALTLPPTMLLDNSHFKTICTRVQLAAQQCPAAAQYGTATATSPLLEGQLSGPVYLVSSSDKLPNLVADLRGQVNVQLRGVITTVKGAMKTTFPTVPDAPVTKFTLKMDSGAKGLIINSKDLCKSSRKGKLNMKGQNTKQVKNNKFVLKASCPKKKK
jgi:hypothetical protein